MAWQAYPAYARLDLPTYSVVKNNSGFLQVYTDNVENPPKEAEKRPRDSNAYRYGLGSQGDAQQGFEAITMPDRENTSFATRLLHHLPQIKDVVNASKEFHQWLENFKIINVDGEQFYLVGGDMLRDYDEMIVDWAREKKIITQETVDQFHEGEEKV